MILTKHRSLAALLTLLTLAANAEELVGGRKSLVMENQTSRLVIDLSGGAIGEYRLKHTELNPLAWGTPAPDDLSIRGFGHFLCLDRWGPPSKAEGAKGMPYHGEASNVPWSLVRDAATRDGVIEARMSARLPKGGLSVNRIIRMSSKEAVFLVREEVTNENALGRIYNMVQHPTIGGPFLDESTLVDCSGRKGFAQGRPMPNPEEPAFFWPLALNQDGETVSMRRMTNNPNPNVVSYSMDTAFGWVTAATPAQGLLIGYLWRSKDYPWVSLWRDVSKGKPAARGLEFGTTGLHQPFSLLVQKGRIWDRQLFEYLDAGETTAKSYTAFLLKVPTDFAGVESIDVVNGKFILHERREAKPRDFSITAEGLIPE